MYKHFITALLLTIAAKSFGEAPAWRPEWVTPAQAVHTAAKVAPDLVKGVFAFEVIATGSQDRMVYLNSEEDYRDQRNLTIAISPKAAAELKKIYRADPQKFLKGKFIAVDGLAERVKVAFFVNGKDSGKYYFQTHVKVDKASQIEVVR